MSEILEIEVRDVMPDVHTIAKNVGLPGLEAADERTSKLLYQALDLVAETARPAGVLREIPVAEFELIYMGEGRNEDEGPVEAVFARGQSLALFAATLGEPVSQRIRDLFSSRDFALASMVDASASEAADRLGERVEEVFLQNLSKKGKIEPSSAVLRYSPGYCGWHVSGQKALFARLQPESTGISLRESCLMEPLKSVSGVVIAGPREIHDIENTSPLCADCGTRDCQERSPREL